MNAETKIVGLDETSALIQLVNVTKSYTKGDSLVTPLADLNLQVKQGEFVALMGPSGSGKTTLLNLIAGIDQPTSGKVLIGGTNIAQLSRTRLSRWRSQHVGYIFQLYHLVPVLTAYENVELPLLLHHLSARERQKRVNMALEAVGLLDRHDHYPRQLSGGQEQRVAIARALVADPTIIVGDEPTGDLDRKAAESTLALLQRLNRELGKTLVIVTHDPHAAAAAQRVIHLEKGVIVDTPGSSGGEQQQATIEVSTQPRNLSVQPNRPGPRPSSNLRFGAVILMVIAVGSFAVWKWKPANGASESDEQEIAIKVGNSYNPDTINVLQNRPVVLKVTRENESTCAAVFEIPDYKVKAALQNHKTAEVRFTPTQSGTIGFQCGSNMMHGQIVVAGAQDSRMKDK